MNFVLLGAAYLLGGIPTSQLVARVVTGIDLREHGSGNLGATNAFRVLGWKPAVPIFFIDIAKGWVPTAFFADWAGATGILWALAYGVAAVLGHVFSPYLRFRGGKGVATGAGMFLALAPLAVLIGLAVWIALVAATGYVSLASMTAAIVLPIAIASFQGIGPIFWLSLALAAFVLGSHRSNIGRLLRGEEHRFGRRTREAS